MYAQIEHARSATSAQHTLMTPLSGCALTQAPGTQGYKTCYAIIQSCFIPAPPAVLPCNPTSRAPAAIWQRARVTEQAVDKYFRTCSSLQGIWGGSYVRCIHATIQQPHCCCCRVCTGLQATHPSAQKHEVHDPNVGLPAFSYHAAVHTTNQVTIHRAKPQRPVMRCGHRHHTCTQHCRIALHQGPTQILLRVAIRTRWARPLLSAPTTG